MHRQPPKPQASGFLKQIRPGRNHQHRNLTPFPHSLAPEPSFAITPLNRRGGWKTDLLDPVFEGPGRYSEQRAARDPKRSYNSRAAFSDNVADSGVRIAAMGF